jgi:8-oxo-dGTP pyrophosphatase MutT (NUDIX family)
MSNTSKENPWKTLDSKKVYESPWIRVDHHEVLNPAGNPGTYSVVHFKKLAVGVVPLDEENNTWLVGQYRYPIQCYTWEIPEGGGDRELDPLESAQRELLEECGLIANQWKVIQELQLSNSATDEIAYLFVARDLKHAQAQPEETEQLTIRKLPFDTVYQMVIDGSITDAISVSAILRVKLMMQEGVI